MIKLKTKITGDSRPPVVVVLGHVDHGKTTLLDSIRKTDVAIKEYGGITQSIGAYQVEVKDGTITFIDTPGHEAFTKMRSRGASVADIAILVVAANDSVMPQTVESIKIIKDAGIPYVVAINKTDLPEANVDKVIQDLLRYDVLLENYGGNVPYLKVSAKRGDGVVELLELIKLLAEMSDIKGDPSNPLEAYVIESKMDKNRGPLATLIIKDGQIKVGDTVVIDKISSKIRALINYKNEPQKEALPGTPVEILGLSSVPMVGSVVLTPGQTLKPVDDTVISGASDLKRSGQLGEQSLSLTLKADTIGSLEAITALIPENVNVVSAGVGEISEADILLAKSTKAIILGFNVKIASSAVKLSEIEKVLVRTYKIIYELLDELKDAASGMLVPVETEEVLGKGKIIAEFPFEKLRIAGTKVTEGRIARGDLVKINDIKSKIKSVRVGKDEITKVEAGKECGILFDPQIDFHHGDDIICYRMV